MQKQYLVTYDLKTPGWNYTGFYNALKNIGPWWHYLDSVWIIKTNNTSQQIHSMFAPHLSKQDFILIVEIVPGSRNGWLKQDAWNWIDGKQI